MKKNGDDTLKIEFLKLKNALIDRYKILIPIFGIILILSGFWVYEASSPTYENKEQNVTTHTDHGWYSYTVPVTKENPLYPIGTMLQMGMPAYFFVVSPTVNMSFTYRLENANPTDINGKLQTFILVTAKEGSQAGGSGDEAIGTGGGSMTEIAGANNSDNGENIFWKKEFTLESENTSDNWNGLSVTKNFSLNVPEIHLKVKAVGDQLNYSGDPTIEIVNRVSYTGKINGENVQATKDFPIPLVIKEPSYYQLSKKLDYSQDNNITEYINVKSNPPLSKMGVPLSLFLLSLILFGMTLVCTRMKKVEPDIIEKLEQEQKHSAFKEFISRGKLPEDKNTLMKIKISSLQELVDAASDMNSRIIFDEEAKTYFMISNGVIYINCI